MHNRAGESGENLALTDIAYHYDDIKFALKAYFAEPSPLSADPDLAGQSPNEVLQTRLIELERSTSLTILAAIEAALKIDYLRRNRPPKLKDNLSKALRKLYKQKAQRVSLEEDILDAWREHGGVDSKLIGDLRGALKYRHWLAHGRYWTPKLGRNYDYFTIYTIADEVFAQFKLIP